MKKSNEYSQKSEKVKNIIGISTIGIAQAMAGGFVGIYIGIFYTDVLGISAASMGLLLLLARLWDAINDPIAGMIMDNSRIRWFGHFKFFLFFGNISLTILTILMFTAPNISITGKLIYAYITYFSWSFFYTLMPIMPLTAVVIDHPKDRSYLAGLQRIVILFIGFSSAAFIPLVEKMGGGSVGFSYAIMIFMVPLMIISLMGTFLIKEPSFIGLKEKVKVKDIVPLFTKNKPMRIFSIYIFLSGMIMPFMNAALAYYVKYNFGANKMTYLMPLAMGGFIIGVCISIISHHVISRKTLLTLAHIIQAIVFLSLYLAGPIPFIVAFILIGIADLTMGLTVIPDSTMSMEIMDYNEETQGKRMAGLVSSLYSLLTKPQAAFAGATIGFLLSSIGFVPDMPLNKDLFQVLAFTAFLLPGIFACISIVMIRFYPIDEKKAISLAEKLKINRNTVSSVGVEP